MRLFASVADFQSFLCDIHHIKAPDFDMDNVPKPPLPVRFSKPNGRYTCTTSCRITNGASRACTSPAIVSR